jgi:hypothetical protein
LFTIAVGRSRKSTILTYVDFVLAFVLRFFRLIETDHLYRSKKKKGRRFRQACDKIKPSKRIICREPVCFKREEKGWPTKKISMMKSTPSSGTAAAAANDRISIAQDGFESFEDIMSLSEKDVSSLAKGFAERTVASGKIVFGLRQTNLLRATVHWAQDFRRISRGPTLDGIGAMPDFKAAIETAKQRAQIRKHNAEESDSLSTASHTGKLKRQKDWLVWSRSLTNYLSTILGQDGLPLSYIIRENDEPDYDEEDKEDFDFEQLSIKCAPLVGVFYKTDARKVHQLIHGFMQGETAETWIKPKEKRQNGRLEFRALQAHYGGEGNKSVRIKEAEVLRNLLHYKNERAMSFEKFPTNMQAMFTVFEDNDELLTDAQKIRLLFQKVQSPSQERPPGLIRLGQRGRSHL